MILSFLVPLFEIRRPKNGLMHAEIQYVYVYL